MKKYKLGYTTGVFDMFHIGHLNILRQAKEQCEKLIVGVSTDELVFDYKKKIPIIPFCERIEIVKAICYVDQVVPQITMDKMEAYKELKFDVLFHGDDWKNSPTYNQYKSQFDAVGVDLVFFSYTQGISSTQLRDKI
jgi:glycerol-3-phosphate cytidylyltransferase